MSEITERLKTAIADRYVIERELGEGGMATVYLAEDLKHDRKVAVKVLRPELAAVLGADRFVQEIKTTASLQHPHILPLFDSGQAGGFLYYVMPYIEGETLRAKLERETQLSVDESVRIATEVADALDYAHRQGVIHRDIKPENILLHDGRPMVADFGIALAVSAAAGGRMTETGLSLGTPHYMSPEQATAEKDLTNRSDIYSLAAVLYEMLTGNPPHTGASAQQIIMKIVTEEAPPVTKVRRSVPANVATALAKSLEKLPADRFESAAAFANALTDRAFVHQPASIADRGPVVRGRPRLGPVAWSGWIVAVLTIVAWVAWPRVRAPERDGTRRFLLDFPAGMEPVAEKTGLTFALSRDGRRLVYVAGSERETMLALKEENVSEPRLVAGTENAKDPSFSPDGAQVAFVRTTGWIGSLEVVSLAGGQPQVVADSAEVLGVTWADDGRIYFSTPSGHLLRARSTGGRLDTLIRPADNLFPLRLASIPGQRGVVFDNGGPIAPLGTMWALDPRNGRMENLGSGSAVAVLPNGYLLYHDGSDLLVTRFDLDALRVVGEPVRVATAIRSFNLAADVAVSETGVLLYVTAGSADGTPAWVDRTGRVQPIDPNWSDRLGAVDLSPAGNRLAAVLYRTRSVVVKHLDTGPLIPIARGTADVAYYRPAWHPGGEVIGFEANENHSVSAVRTRRADGVDGDASPDEAASGFVAWSPDGDWRLMVRYRGDPGNQIVALPTSGDGDSVTLGSGAFRYVTPQMSPDSRWLAYVSDETGPWDVFVRPFPNLDSTRIAISVGGGVQPRWSGTGAELFYVSSENQLVVAQVTLAPTFQVRSTESLFATDPFWTRPFPWGLNYDVTEDGQRFVMTVRRGRNPFVWVDGWMNELPAEMR